MKQFSVYIHLRISRDELLWGGGEADIFFLLLRVSKVSQASYLSLSSHLGNIADSDSIYAAFSQTGREKKRRVKSCRKRCRTWEVKSLSLFLSLGATAARSISFRILLTIPRLKLLIKEGGGEIDNSGGENPCITEYWRQFDIAGSVKGDRINRRV